MLGTSPSHVRRLDASDAPGEAVIDKLAFEIVRTSSLRNGDLVLCAAGDVIPTDGIVVEGRAALADGAVLDASERNSASAGDGLHVSEGVRLAAGHFLICVRVNDG